MRVVKAFSCLVLLSCLVAGGAGAEGQAARREAFAFANTPGTRLLALSPISHPERPYRAVCPGGKVFRVKFVKRKQATPKDTGRATAANFDNSAGDLFRIVGGRTGGDGTCLLIEDASLNGKTIVKPTSLRDKRCDPLQSKKVADEKGRAVAQCWRKLRLTAGKELLLVLFEGKGKDALASLVLFTPRKLAFMDFPGQNDPTSTWRVDDGGVLEPAYFEVLFILAEGDALEIALSWAGVEGDALRLLKVEAESFQTILEGYRYWAPS